MKFRFVGELDAPDWLLRELGEMSKVTSVRVKLITRQVINRLLGGEIQYEKVFKLLSVADFDSSDVKAMIAAIVFIMSNAAKHNVDWELLADELQQLGLPREHSRSISRSYRDRRELLREQFSQQILSLPRLESVNWRVDYILSSNSLEELNAPSVMLNINLLQDNDNEDTEKYAFEVSADKLRLLIHELKTAQNLLNNAVSK